MVVEQDLNSGLSSGPQPSRVAIIVHPQLDTFACGSLCALGLGGSATGPGLSDIGRALGATQPERCLCKDDEFPLVSS